MYACIPECGGGFFEGVRVSCSATAFFSAAVAASVTLLAATAPLLIAYDASPAHAAGDCTITSGTTRIFSPRGSEDTFVVPEGVEGPGAVQFAVSRDTGGDFRIFTIDSDNVVTISRTTVFNGNRPGSPGGGIFNQGSLTI